MRACSVVYDSLATLWTGTCQTPLSIGFPTPILDPGDLLNSGIKPVSFVSPVLVGGFFTTAPPQKPLSMVGNVKASVTVQHIHILIF